MSETQIVQLRPDQVGTITIDGQPASRPEWLTRRKGGIGASESPIVLGLKPSRLKLYLRKIGELPEDEPSEEMRWGLRLEDDIVDAYQERTGRRVARTQVFGAHPEHEGMIATLDGITECGRVVEFKSVGLYGPARQLGDDGDSETLPDSFVVQVNQQLAIAGALGLADPDEADIVVFGPSLQLRIFAVRRNDDLVAMTADAIRSFMEDHVIPRIPPPELIPDDAETLVRAYRRDSGEILTLGDTALDAAVRYTEIGKAIRELEQERARAKAELLMALGDASGAALPGGWEIRRRLIEVKEHAVKASTQVRLTVKGPR